MFRLDRVFRKHYFRSRLLKTAQIQENFSRLFSSKAAFGRVSNEYPVKSKNKVCGKEIQCLMFERLNNFHFNLFRFLVKNHLYADCSLRHFH